MQAHLHRIPRQKGYPRTHKAYFPQCNLALCQAFLRFLGRDFDEANNLRVCEGYFSGDKKSEENEANAVALILCQKERLLSLKTPLRFIFSVWALQEGWDNPNIFTLTKLANSASETSKRQQIGRGLRLCVNQNGKRITQNACEGEDAFYEINTLDVLVHNSEVGFIEGLQREISADSFVASSEFIKRDELERLGLNERQINRFCNALEDMKLVEFDDENYKITANIYEGIKENAKMREILGEKSEEILRFYAPNANKREQIKNANKKSNQVAIRRDLAEKFRESWRILNTKAKITYENIDEDSLKAAIIDEFNAQEISAEKVKFEQKIYNAKEDKIEYIQSESVNEKKVFLDKLAFKNLQEFSHKENLPLRFVLEIYNACRGKFSANPNAAFSELKTCIKEQIHQKIISCAAYKFGEIFISANDPLFDTNGTPKDFIDSYKLGRILGEEAKEPYLYERAVWDSDIEKHAILNDGKHAKIKVFAKLPKLQIPTPYKNYEPDFAYLIEHEKRQIIFVCETKGYDDKRDISPQERDKIKYAERFFADLQRHLKDKVVVKFKKRLNRKELGEILEEILEDS